MCIEYSSIFLSICLSTRRCTDLYIYIYIFIRIHRVNPIHIHVYVDGAKYLLAQLPEWETLFDAALNAFELAAPSGLTAQVIICMNIYIYI